MEKPITVDWTRHHRIHRAAQAIARGGVVAYPTESIWGLGCDPLDGEAVDKILRLKGRAVTKGLIMIAATLDQALPFLAALTAAERQHLVAAEARSVTWVVPASPLVPGWITGGRPTLALRITRHPLAAALCAVADTPLVSTSANPQGRPPARSALQVRQYFDDLLADITPGAVGGAAKPSEIRDLRSGEILRPGD